MHQLKGRLLDRDHFAELLAKQRKKAPLKRMELLVVDIDRLWELRSEYGPNAAEQASDRLAREVSRSLPDWLLGRMADGSIAAFCSEPPPAQTAATVRALQRSFASPELDAQPPVRFTVSIGWLVEHRPELEPQLLEKAFKAMKRVRTEGGDGVVKETGFF